MCRCPLSQNVPSPDPTDLQEAVSGVCTHLLPSLSRGGAAGSGTSHEHELQALCSIHRRARTGERKGLLGSLRRTGGQHVEERLKRLRRKCREGGARPFPGLLTRLDSDQTAACMKYFFIAWWLKPDHQPICIWPGALTISSRDHEFFN